MIDPKGVGVRLKILNNTFDGKLPERVGFSEAEWHNYESGLRLIGPEKAFAIAQATGATLDFIFTGDASSLPKSLFDKIRQYPPV